MSLTGNKDVDLKIMDYLNDEDLLNVSLINKRSAHLCNDENFWRNRYFRNYGFVHSRGAEEMIIGEKISFKNPDRSWKEYYLLVMHYDSKYYPRMALKLVAEKGYLDLVKFFLEYLKDECGDLEDLEFSDIIFDAAKNNHKDVLQYIYEKYWHGDLEFGLFGTAFGGHRDLLEYFIRKLQEQDNINVNDLDTALMKAAEGNHKEIIQRLIALGANDWLLGLQGAAKGGHKNLVDYFISLGTDGIYNAALSAAEGGHKDLVEYLKTKGSACLDTPMSVFFIYAAQGGNIDLVKSSISKKFTYATLIKAVECAAYHGHKQVLEFLFEYFATVPLEQALEYSAMGGHKNLVEWLVELGVKKFEYAAELAKNVGYKELEQYFTQEAIRTHQKKVLKNNLTMDNYIKH